MCACVCVCIKDLRVNCCSTKLWNSCCYVEGDSRLASSHLEIYVSLFQPATVVSKKMTV